MATDKFKSAENTGKIQILTILPKRWSTCQTETEFGAS
jgi:hypothetical protein